MNKIRTAVIGCGGKSSLRARLARELPGSVLLTTTTHIRPFCIPKSILIGYLYNGR